MSPTLELAGKKIGENVPLSAKEVADPRITAPNTEDFKGQFARAVVWEIWDRVPELQFLSFKNYCL